VPARGAAQRCRLDLNTAQFGNAGRVRRGRVRRAVCAGPCAHVIRQQICEQMSAS
jgi:hypothetical protein